jgi:hypothetical protein
MNRRSFLSRLVLGVVSLPAISKAVAAPVRAPYGRGLTENLVQRDAADLMWKQQWRANPEYETATHHIVFLTPHGAVA